MGQASSEGGGTPVLARMADGWSATSPCTHAVIHQQLSGQAAGTILGRFRALFGDDGFPTPEAVLKASPERLRSAGLSRPKASYVLGIAQKAVDGHIPTLDECDRMTDAEIVERLTSIKGVGRWTAEMLLIFNLGRPDVLPVDDLGVRKGFQFAYGKRKLPEPEQLARYGLRWSPHRPRASCVTCRTTRPFRGARPAKIWLAMNG